MHLIWYVSKIHTLKELICRAVDSGFLVQLQKHSWNNLSAKQGCRVFHFVKVQEKAADCLENDKLSRAQDVLEM